MVPAHDPAELHPTADATPEPRSDLDLFRQQLAAIEHWHQARRATQEAAQRTTASRETRMDLARRLDVIRAEHRAIVERTDAQLRSSVELLQRTTTRRAIVVHRNSWFMDKVAADLGLRDIVVVARLTNGAEAVGAVVAEQPDLLLVEDTLPMMSGEDVVREVRTFAPLTRIGAQVAYDDRIAALLEAGAHSAYTRRVPPADVAAALAGLLATGARPTTGAPQRRG
jgi:CheY-like chemotaxis protein